MTVDLEERLGKKKRSGLDAPATIVPRDFLYRPVLRIIHPFALIAYNFSSENAEAIPRNGPIIIFSEHTTGHDIPALLHTVNIKRGRNMRILHKSDLAIFGNRYFAGKILGIIGYHPVDRRWPESPMNQSAYDYLEDRLIEHGDAFVIFPRGTRRNGAKLKTGSIKAGISILEQHPEIEIPVLAAYVAHDKSGLKLDNAHTVVSDRIYERGMNYLDLRDAIDREFTSMRNKSQGLYLR